MKKIYNKLVRDKIPQIIENSGNTCRTEILDDNLYLEMLDKKLDEECLEYQTDKSCEELADILEVVYAIALARGCSAEKLDSIREDKALKRGAFKDKILLVDVEEKQV